MQPAFLWLYSQSFMGFLVWIVTANPCVIQETEMTVTEIVNELLLEMELLEMQEYTLAAETIRKFLRIATPIQVKALEDFV